jgi:hypothetical protein
MEPRKAWGAQGTRAAGKSPGVLFFGNFLLDKQKKVTRNLGKERRKESFSRKVAKFVTNTENRNLGEGSKFPPQIQPYGPRSLRPRRN